MSLLLKLEQQQQKSVSPGSRGEGTPIHYLYGYVPQRGRDFEAPDLERGIHFRGVF